MAKKVATLALIRVVIAAVLLAEAPTAIQAAACDPMQLLPCAGAYLSDNAAPSSQCCTKLREQEHCLCEFKKNPRYRAYASSPNAERIARTCRVSIGC